MGRKRNHYINGSVGLVGSGAWGLYSSLTTIRGLPEDAGWIAKMIADPPVYAPWLLFAVCVLFLAWVFWKREEPEEPQSPTLNQTTSGDGSHAIGSIGNLTLNAASPLPNLSHAAMPKRAEMLHYIDEKFCVSVFEMLKMLRMHDTFQNNLLIHVGAQCGLSHIEKSEFERAQDFFEGGGTKLKFHISQMSPGPAPEFKLPKNKIVYVNFTKEFGDLSGELKKLSQSPFLPSEVAEGVENLSKTIESISEAMIKFLDNCYQNQRIRLTMAVKDSNVAGGLFNDFMRASIDLETPITALRSAISRSLK